MAAALRRLEPGDESLFDAVAPEVFDAPIDAAWLGAYLRTPGHMMVVALLDGQIVGQCAGVIHHHPDKPDELYVDEVGTATTHLRRGIARRMLAELFAWARERGCTEAWLGTESDNGPALALYRGLTPVEDEAIRYFLFKL